MGMSYWAEIVVGLPYEEVGKDLKEKVQEEEFYQQDIEDKSPYYDGGGQGLFGITVKSSDDFSYDEINFDKLTLKINEARYTFKQNIGIEPKVYITTRGC